MQQTESSDRVATILAMFTKHADDWQPTTPGHPSQSAEHALDYMLDAGDIQPRHLPMVHRLIVDDLPAARAFGGPYRPLLRALGHLPDAASVPVIDALYAERQARGVDAADFIEPLAALAAVPSATALLVRILVQDRPRGVAGLLHALAEHPENATHCFPALNPLLTDGAYGWSILELAASFQAQDQLPPASQELLADAICDELCRATEAWLSAMRANRHRDEELDHFKDVIRLATGFTDHDVVLNAIAEIALAAGAEVAVPAMEPLLQQGLVPPPERLQELAATGPHMRRQLYDLLARYDATADFPASHMTPEAWAEVEIAEFLNGQGYPTPPNQLICLGHAHWTSGPDTLMGTYYIFATTGIQEWEAEMGRGDMDTTYLVASGPHSNSILIKPTCEPWPLRRGTRANWATPINPDRPDDAWQDWMRTCPVPKKTTGIRTRPRAI